MKKERMKIACAAMQALIGNSTSDADPKEIAGKAIEYADCLLDCLKKKKEKPE